MVFRNSIKIFINKFGLVWSLLLYLAVFMVLLCGISLPFVLLLYNSLNKAGIFAAFGDLINSILKSGSVDRVIFCADELMLRIEKLFSTDFYSFLSSLLFVFLVLLLVNRFILGLYEIPLATVLDGYLGANASIGFMGRLFGEIRISFSYVMLKVFVTVIYDLCAVGIISLLIILIRALGIGFVLPFVFMLVVIVLLALRFTFLCLWSPMIVAEKKPPKQAFKHSFRLCIKKFKSIFSMYLVLWIVVIALNFFIGVYTFGAGLILTIPLCMVFFSILNHTMLYTYTERRYYVDNAIVN